MGKGNPQQEIVIEVMTVCLMIEVFDTTIPILTSLVLQIYLYGNIYLSVMSERNVLQAVLNYSIL